MLHLHYAQYIYNKHIIRITYAQNLGNMTLNNFTTIKKPNPPNKAKTTILIQKF